MTETKNETPATEPYDYWTQYNAETALEGERRKEIIDTARKEWTAAKSRAKAKKEVYESLLEEYFGFLDERKAGKTQPTLFAPPVGEPQTEPQPQPETGTVGIQSFDDAWWRTESVDAFVQHGLPAKVIEKLKGAGLNTLGELSDYTQPNLSGFSRSYTDVEGIGKAKAEKIEDAWVQFWTANANRVNTNADATTTGSGNEGDGTPSEERGNDHTNEPTAVEPSDPDPNELTPEELAGEDATVAALERDEDGFEYANDSEDEPANLSDFNEGIEETDYSAIKG